MSSEMKSDKTVVVFMQGLLRVMRCSHVFKDKSLNGSSDVKLVLRGHTTNSLRRNAQHGNAQILISPWWNQNGAAFEVELP